MHDSFSPLGGGLVLSHMMLGEISPGGVGVGLNGLLIMAVLSVFIASLIVGRTPEYLGVEILASDPDREAQRRQPCVTDHRSIVLTWRLRCRAASSTSSHSASFADEGSYRGGPDHAP